MPEYKAYPLMRDKFLNHPSERYTHLIICPDDLLIDDKNKIQMLLDNYNDIEPSERDNTIMSGYCNVDHGINGKFANITIADVSPLRKGRIYNWVRLDELEHKKRLISVKFAGFPLFAIPRNIVEQIPFRNDSPTGHFDGCGCCVDVMFCHDVIKMGAKIFVDPRVKLNHLKISDQKTSETIFKSAYLPDHNPHFFIEYSENKKLMVN